MDVRPPVRRRLYRYEIAVLRDLAKRAGASGRVSLATRQRRDVVDLWRRGFVEVWYRQSCETPSLRGPFFSLTVTGFHLATAFLSPSKRTHHHAVQR